MVRRKKRELAPLRFSPQNQAKVIEIKKALNMVSRDKIRPEHTRKIIDIILDPRVQKALKEVHAPETAHLSLKDSGIRKVAFTRSKKGFGEVLLKEIGKGGYLKEDELGVLKKTLQGIAGGDELISIMHKQKPRDREKLLISGLKTYFIIKEMGLLGALKEK